MDCPGVLHMCGDITETLKNMLTCGFNGINIDKHVNITQAKKLLAELNSPTRICGNISIDETLFLKKPKDVINETIDTLAKGVDVLSPSCMIAPNTSLNNIKAIIKARNKFFDMEDKIILKC